MRRFLTDLFSRDHVITASWAILIGALGFLGGRSVDWLSGPQQVYVTNSQAPPDTLTIVHLGPGDSVGAIDARLDAIAREIESLRGAAQGPAMILPPDDPSVQNLLQPNHIALSRFRLPANVQGYTGHSFGRFADLTCPAEQIESGSVLSFAFRVLNGSVVPRLTPLFVDIHRPTGANTVTLMTSEQYVIREGWNRVDLVLEASPGDLRLIVGAYLRDELGERYPPFYRSVCQLSVVSPP